MPEPVSAISLAKHRRTLLVALAIVTLVSLAGLPRLRFSDDYREIFRSEDASFALLEELGREFGADEQRIAMVVKAAETDGEPTGAPFLLGPEGIAVIESLQTGAASLEGVSRTSSLVSVSGLPQLFASAEEGTDRQEVLRAIRAQPLLIRRLLSEDMKVALVLVDLEDERRSLAEIETVISDLEALAHSASAETGAEVLITGLPALRLEIVRGIQRDQVVFTTVGLLLGGLIALAVFRSFIPALLVGVGPVLGAVWTLGSMGWLGEPIDVINNVVPVLILVIGMTDSVHLVRAFQQARSKGVEVDPAVMEALRRVGPACAMTSLTTVVGFSSLALADLEIVRRFGLTCALGLALCFLAVITTVPLATSSRIGLRIPAASPSARWNSELVGLRSGRAAKVVTVIGLLLLGLLALSFWDLEPDYRYREYLPAEGTLQRGLDLMDRHLGGSSPVYVVIDWEEDVDPSEVLVAIQDVEEELDKVVRSGITFSVLDLLRSTIGDDRAGWVEALDLIPESTRRDVYRPDTRRALVSILVADVGASRLGEDLDLLDTGLQGIAQRYPGVSLRPSGMLHVSTVASLRMLRLLSRSLALATVVILLVICLGLRSLRLGLISVPPNLYPLAAVGACLWLTDRPLQFTTVTLLTICLGIAVDDSIHFLMDFRRERLAGLATSVALEKTLLAVGPSLVITTALLVAGFGAVSLSRAPMMRLFGWLGCLALVVA